MNGEESDDSITILVVGVIFTVLIFFIVIGIIVYFSIGDTDIKGTITGSSGRSGETGDQRLQNLLDSLSEIHNRTINDFNTTARDNGFPEFVMDMDSELKPNEISRVEIINASGETETVQVCDNRSGFQPLYIGKHLVCSNGMLEVTNNNVDPPLKCCAYNLDFSNMPNKAVPETLAMHAFNAINTVEGAMGFCGNTNGEEECSIPMKYKAMGALLMGAYMKKDWFKTAFRQAKRIHGTQKALANTSDFFTESIKTKKETNAIAKSVSSAGRNTMKRARYIKFKKGFFEAQKGFVEEVRGAENDAEEAREALETARNTGKEAEEIARLSAAVEKAESKIVLKTFVRSGVATGKLALKGVGAILSIDAAVGAACSAAIGWSGVGEIACGGVIVLMDIALAIDLAVGILDSCDIGGFQQYQPNEDAILPSRDQQEGTVINTYNVFGETPPFTFSLSSISILPTVDTKSELADLKNIKDIFNMALEEYEHSIPQFKPNEPRRNNQTSITQAILRGTRVLEGVHTTLYATINDNPRKRDDHLWNYLKTHLNDSNKTQGANENVLKYIMYVPELTSHKIIAITLNDAGIELYNTEAERLNNKFIPPNEDGTEDPTYKNDPEKIASPLPLLIKTKYYRTIYNVENQGTSSQRFILEQNELPQPFTLESYSMGLIKAQCTTGMDPEDLPNKDAIKEHPTMCGLGETEILHPNDHGCDGPGEPECYNKDTGLCNTTLRWCEEMGMGVLVDKIFTGDGEVGYKDCDTSGAQDVFSFLISDEGAKYYQRSKS